MKGAGGGGVVLVWFGVRLGFGGFFTWFLAGIVLTNETSHTLFYGGWWWWGGPGLEREQCCSGQRRSFCVGTPPPSPGSKSKRVVTDW